MIIAVEQRNCKMTIQKTILTKKDIRQILDALDVGEKVYIPYGCKYIKGNKEYVFTVAKSSESEIDEVECIKRHIVCPLDYGFYKDEEGKQHYAFQLPHTTNGAYLGTKIIYN